MDETLKEFIPPPEAPIFEPSWEEFQDPLAYIDKIRPVAEQHGICKIRPPPSWQPPFAVDVDTFRFTPRIQKLNELEAFSRVKMNFIDQLTKFWNLQGITLKIPIVEKKYLDLHRLRKMVSQEGGYIEVCKKNIWSQIANRLNYVSGKGIGSALRSHYEKIIFPYDVFETGLSTKRAGGTENNNKNTDVYEFDAEEKPEMKIEKIERTPTKKSGKAQKQRRMASDVRCRQPVLEDEKPVFQCFSSGTKITITTKNTSPGKLPQDVRIKQEPLPYDSSVRSSLVDKYYCEVCAGGDDDAYMLLCDGCDAAYHTYCLIPPMDQIPPGDWRCPKCVAKECSKPLEAYGFEQSAHEYNLETFGAMADQFKANHFNMPPHTVPFSDCEKEFWRLVRCPEEDISVEYGADIHAGEQGSGFPTEKTRERFLGDEEYITSGWNLNNLPNSELSVLQYVSVDISGMKVPWCYVGMCFSSFSWHTEDHWSYSVNYMHWGEPKTWYGVPGSKAELLEESMMKEAPELFVQHPDLLHQLTTIMNPNILMDYGVPIYRTDQCPGEFVITFPRSYHAGFNQGYNFAEAVNFCPPDWVALGRACIEDYRRLHRQCVFSHEELLCEMAEKSKSVNIRIAKVVHDDLQAVFEKETILRKKLDEQGVVESERQVFELIQDDDERQCDVCKTTCFLSAVTCPLKPNLLICLEHPPVVNCSCDASKHCLKYRYTLDELAALVLALKLRSESFEKWKDQVNKVFKPTDNKKPDISHLKDLILEVTTENLPKVDLLENLKDAVSCAESSIESARQLMNKKVNSRQKTCDMKLVPKLTIQELKGFCDRVQRLSCTFKEANLIQDLHDNVIKFQTEANVFLSSESLPTASRLQELIDWGSSLDVEFIELHRLSQFLQQSRWLNEYNSSMNATLSIPVLQKLVANGTGFALHPTCQVAMSRLKSLLMSCENLEQRAINCIASGSELVVIEAIVKDSELVSVQLPQVEALKGRLKLAKEWLVKVKEQEIRGHGLHISELERLIQSGCDVPVKLDVAEVLRRKLEIAKSWKSQVTEIFFGDGPTSLLQDWFSEIGIDRDPPNVEDPTCIPSVENGFKCPNKLITLESLQEVLKWSLDNLKKAKMANTQRLLEQGRMPTPCHCKRNVQSHVHCCVQCTNVFYEDCDVTSTNSQPSNHLTTFGQVPAKLPVHLCSYCKNVGQSPSVDSIVSLVGTWYQMNGVCVLEGRALLYLKDMACEWQQKAKKILSTRELLIALELIDITTIRDYQRSGSLVPDTFVQLLKNPVHHPKLLSLDISNSMQTHMSDMLVESLAMKIDSEESLIIRSLLYACYEKVVLLEALRWQREQERRREEEEERKRQEEERRKKEEERLRRLEEERKREEEAKRRKLEEERKRAAEEKRMRELELLRLEEERKKQEEMKRLKELEKQRLEELEKKRLEKEKEKKRLDELEKKRLEKELENKRLEELEKKRLEKEKEKKRLEELEKKRFEKKKLEEQEKKRLEKEKEKKKMEEQEKKRLEDKMRQDSENQQRKEQEMRKKEKEEENNSKKGKQADKKQGNLNRKNGMKRSSTEYEPADEDTDDENSAVKKKKTEKGKGTAGAQSASRNKKKSTKKESTVEDWTYCAAKIFKKCLKPTGKKIEWVECDDCKGWYHNECEGVTEIPAENEKWVCTYCRKTEETEEEDSEDGSSDESHSPGRGKKTKTTPASSTLRNGGKSKISGASAPRSASVSSTPKNGGKTKRSGTTPSHSTNDSMPKSEESTKTLGKLSSAHSSTLTPKTGGKTGKTEMAEGSKSCPSSSLSKPGIVDKTEKTESPAASSSQPSSASKVWNGKKTEVWGASSPTPSSTSKLWNGSRTETPAATSSHPSSVPKLWNGGKTETTVASTSRLSSSLTPQNGGKGRPQPKKWGSSLASCSIISPAANKMDVDDDDDDDSDAENLDNLRGSTNQIFSLGSSYLYNPWLNEKTS